MNICMIFCIAFFIRMKKMHEFLQLYSRRMLFINRKWKGEKGGGGNTPPCSWEGVVHVFSHFSFQVEDKNSDPTLMISRYHCFKMLYVLFVHRTQAQLCPFSLRVIKYLKLIIALTVSICLIYEDQHI